MKSKITSFAATHLQRMEVWLYGAYAWVLFIIVFLTAGGLISLLQTPQWGRHIAHNASRMLYFLGGMSLTTSGLEQLPRAPHILLVNHSSFVDGIALSAMLPAAPGFSFVVRQQYNSQILFYPLLRGLGAVVLSRHVAHSGDSPQKSRNIEKLMMALQRGECLVIFPEGGFRREPGLLPFHAGAFVAAAQAEVPILVAAMRGARDEMSPGTWLPKRADLSLTIGACLMARGKDARTIEALEEEAYAAMQEMLNE